MTAIKLVETYAINSLRRDVRDALVMGGEQCILLQMYHPEVDTDQPRCPVCQDDVYTGGEGECDICYGTSVEGGVKAARRVHGLFTDHAAAEVYNKQGMWPNDVREIQTEAFPLLLERDVVVRITDWNTNNTPAAVEGFYNIAAVVRTSLRTGTRSGQQGWDVVGQRAAITKMNQSMPITQYPVVGVDFTSPDLAPDGYPVGVHSPPVVQPGE
jgi:hypothetical protein